MRERVPQVMVEAMQSLAANASSHIVKNADHLLLESGTEREVIWIGTEKQLSITNENLVIHNSFRFRKTSIS